MTDLRTAAQQALEALKMMRDEYGEANCPACDHADAAVYALNDALAEPNRAQKMRDAGYTRRPTLREMAESEPCQYPDCVDNGPDGKCTRWLLAECSKSEDYKPKRPAEPVLNPAPGYCKHCKQYTIEEPLPAEPVQEPVGFDQLIAETEADPVMRQALADGRHWVAEQLYTVPPQRKPLTDDGMLDLISAAGGNSLRIPLASAINLVRAVEAAHGIKEGT